ncbi:LytTR family DNA-binding domain-containing protein [Colwellia asteriadis]
MNSLIKNTYIGWAAYFIIFNIYCIFWRQYLFTEQYDFVDSLTWWLKEWGMWLAYTPLTISSLAWLKQRKSLITSFIIVGLLSIFLATFTREVIYFVTDNANWRVDSVIPHVIAYFPKYSITFVLIALCWYLSLFQQKLNSTSTPSVSESNTNESNADENNTNNTTSIHTHPVSEPLKHCNTQLVHADNTIEKHKVAITGINVEHLGLTITLPFDEVYLISAAGNYVDIICQNTQYILRTPLKGMLANLPEQQFMQVHRSHIVNLSKIIQLSTNGSGTSQITLDNQQTINISKKLKHTIKTLVHA